MLEAAMTQRAAATCDDDGFQAQVQVPFLDLSFFLLSACTHHRTVRPSVAHCAMLCSACDGQRRVVMGR